MTEGFHGGDRADQVAFNQVKLGTDWSDKEAAASLLEESRRAIRAQLAVGFLEEVSSATKAELMAEADPKYMDHLKSMVQARKVANIAKVNYDAGKVWVDIVRTSEASRRAEMNMR